MDFAGISVAKLRTQHSYPFQQQQGPSHLPSLLIFHVNSNDMMTSDRPDKKTAGWVTETERGGVTSLQIEAVDFLEEGIKPPTPSVSVNAQQWQL